MRKDTVKRWSITATNPLTLARETVSAPMTFNSALRLLNEVGRKETVYKDLTLTDIDGQMYLI